MTKGEILDRFCYINHAYNDSTRYDTLSRSIDEMLDSIKTEIKDHCERNYMDGDIVAKELLRIIDRYK